MIPDEPFNPEMFFRGMIIHAQAWWEADTPLLLITLVHGLSCSDPPTHPSPEGVGRIIHAQAWWKPNPLCFPPPRLCMNYRAKLSDDPKRYQAIPDDPS
jgi:hypothetical protein